MDTQFQRDPTSYGYGRELVEGKAESVCPANTGDAVVSSMPARNMHEVGRVDLEPMPELGLPYTIGRGWRLVATEGDITEREDGREAEIDVLALILPSLGI